MRLLPILTVKQSKPSQAKRNQQFLQHVFQVSILEQEWEADGILKLDLTMTGHWGSYIYLVRGGRRKKEGGWLWSVAYLEAFEMAFEDGERGFAALRFDDERCRQVRPL